MDMDTLGIPGIKKYKRWRFFMKQKKISKLLGLMSAAALSLGMFLCPAVALPAQAATSNDEAVMPQSEIIEWRYFISGDKIYKCLYNYSRAEWVGEWIYVRDVPDKGKA